MKLQPDILEFNDNYIIKYEIVSVSRIKSFNNKTQFYFSIHLKNNANDISSATFSTNEDAEKAREEFMQKVGWLFDEAQPVSTLWGVVGDKGQCAGTGVTDYRVENKKVDPNFFWKS